MTRDQAVQVIEDLNPMQGENDPATPGQAMALGYWILGQLGDPELPLLPSRERVSLLKAMMVLEGHGIEIEAMDGLPA